MQPYLNKLFLVLLCFGAVEMQTANAQLDVSTNRRHLQQADGTPFYWLGDTGWALFQKPDREEVKYYMKTRAKQGFSVIHAAVCHVNPFVTPALQNRYGDRPFIDGDPNRPYLTPGNNPEDTLAYDYWDHVEYVINTAADYGIYINILPVFVMAEEKGQGYNFLDPESAYTYGKFIGDRFKDKTNLIWCMGGDVLADNDYRKSIWDQMARGVTEGYTGSNDDSRILMTFHTRGGHSSSDYFPDAAWLDFDMLQTWDAYTRIYGVVSADYHKEPIKPILHGEGAYEDGPEYPTKPINPFVIRKQIYWAVFAGGMHTYGNSNIWSFGTNSKYVTQDWKAAVKSAGAEQAGISRKIMERLRWWQFEPSAALINSGAGTGNELNVAMLNADKTQAMVYLSYPSTVSLALDKLVSPSGKIKATWIDPKTGKRTSAGKYQQVGEHQFTSPRDWEDALLWLKTK